MKSLKGTPFELEFELEFPDRHIYSEDYGFEMDRQIEDRIRLPSTRTIPTVTAEIHRFLQNARSD